MSAKTFNEESTYPLVSVIVPSYNHGRFVRETLDSIAKQTYPSIQLIVIDDASKDDSQKIILDFSKHYPTEICLKEANGGLIRALNEGLAMARGKYVSLCASDDFWDPEKVSKQIALFEKDAAIKILFTEGYEIDEKGRLIDTIKYTSRPIEKWTFDDVIMKADLPPASFIARRDDMMAVGGFSSEFRIEDLPMWLMLLEGGGYAMVIREKLAFYRSHSSNMHNVFSSMVVDQHFEIIKKFSEGRSDKRKILNEWRLRNANMLASNDKMRSIKYLLPALYKLTDYRLYASLYKYAFR